MDSPLSLPVGLSVAIVLHRSDLLRLRHTLDGLQRAVSRARSEGVLGTLQLYVMDNASGGAYQAEVARLLEPWWEVSEAVVEFVILDENQGFSAGHNRPLVALESTVHLVLNPDVELHETALAVGLRGLREQPEAVLLSPLVSAEDGTQTFLCRRYPSLLVLLLRGFAPTWLQRPFLRRLEAYEMRDVCRCDPESWCKGSGDHPPASSPVPVPIASGCYMLLRTDALRAVGGFDERYFLYFEDYDLSLRLAQHGSLLFFPAMRIVHHGGYAARKGVRHLSYFLRSAGRFFHSHGWRFF